MKGHHMLRYLPFFVLGGFFLLIALTSCGESILPMNSDGGKPFASQSETTGGESTSSQEDVKDALPAAKQASGKAEPANESELQLTKHPDNDPDAASEEPDSTPMTAKDEPQEEIPQVKPSPYTYYTSGEYEFEFKYKTEWKLYEDNDGQVVLANMSLTDPFVRGLPDVDGLVKISLTFELFDAPETFDEWFAAKSSPEKFNDVVTVNGKKITLNLYGENGWNTANLIRPIKPLGAVYSEFYVRTESHELYEKAKDEFLKLALSLQLSNLDD